MSWRNPVRSPSSRENHRSAMASPSVVRAGRSAGYYLLAAADTFGPPDVKSKPVAAKGSASAGFACVYVIGRPIEGPVKVGWASNVLDRLGQIQVANWEEVAVLAVFWTAGPPLAKRLEAKAHELLDKAKKRVRGEWFGVSAEEAARVIGFGAHALSIEIMTNEEKNAMVSRMLAEKKARDWDAFR